MCVYFCGGSCVEDISSHLMEHVSLHPLLRTCSADTILRAIKELTSENISYTSDFGKSYDFNTSDTLNTLLLNCLLASGLLKEGECYDVDFDHQFIETEKYDAKPTYKKFTGYRPGVAVIGDMIVGIENSDGNTNVRFHQEDTLRRFFERLEYKGLTVNRFRADCGSCSEVIVDEVSRHCRKFYIRANRCSSLYDDIFALRGWRKEEINGIEFELNPTSTAKTTMTSSSQSSLPGWSEGATVSARTSPWRSSQNPKKTFSNTVPTAPMPSTPFTSAARSSHSTIYIQLQLVG